MVEITDRITSLEAARIQAPLLERIDRVEDSIGEAFDFLRDDKKRIENMEAGMKHDTAIMQEMVKRIEELETGIKLLENKYDRLESLVLDCARSVAGILHDKDKRAKDGR